MMDTLRAAMSRADKTVTTVPTAEVKTLRSWDKLAEQVHKTRSYLVQCQGEEHRAENTLAECRTATEQATVLHNEAKRQFAQMANDALGIGLEQPEKDARVDAVLEEIEREADR